MINSILYTPKLRFEGNAAFLKKQRKNIYWIQQIIYTLSPLKDGRMLFFKVTFLKQYNWFESDPNFYSNKKERESKLK